MKSEGKKGSVALGRLIAVLLVALYPACVYMGYGLGVKAERQRMAKEIRVRDEAQRLAAMGSVRL